MIGEYYYEGIIDLNQLTPERRKVYYWDTEKSKWCLRGYRLLGIGVSEMCLELSNNITKKPMLEQAEKMLQHAANVPGIQSKLDKLEKKVSEIKTINPDNYVECEVCGNLVRKGKAQTCASVNEPERYNFSGTTFILGAGEKSAVLHYLCNHCDMKKFKKENKY